MPRLSRNQIESFLEEDSMVSNEHLTLLRTVSQKLGRSLTDAERNALLCEKLPQVFSLGIPMQRSANADAEHVSLREKLLALK